MKGGDAKFVAYNKKETKSMLCVPSGLKSNEEVIIVVCSACLFPTVSHSW